MTGWQVASRPQSLSAALAGWGALILAETLSQVALKMAGGRLDGLPLDGAWLLHAAGEPLVWLGVLGYCGSFAAWMTILDRIPLSRGFPLTAVIYVAVTGASVALFHEAVGPLRGLGIALIVAGVAVVGSEDAG